MRSLISFLLIGVAAAGWLFIFQPEWTTVRSLRQDVAAVAALRDEIDGLIVKRDELYAQYQAIPAAEVSRLMAVAPESPKTQSMIITLEALAQKSGVTLKQLEFTSASPGGIAQESTGAYAVIPLGFGIDGTYDNFLLFLKSVERNARLIDVSDFGFSELNLAQRMGFSIRGKMYYRR